MPANWIACLALAQLSFAGFAILAICAPRTRPVRAALIGATVWFVIQAIDQVVAGNFFRYGLWEYPILAIYAYFIHRFNGSPE